MHFGGDLRVIYYGRAQGDDIWLLTLYAKNEAGTIPARILERIAEGIKNGGV